MGREETREVVRRLREVKVSILELLNNCFVRMYWIGRAELRREDGKCMSGRDLVGEVEMLFLVVRFGGLGIKARRGVTSLGRGPFRAYQPT